MACKWNTCVRWRWYRQNLVVVQSVNLSLHHENVKNGVCAVNLLSGNVASLLSFILIIAKRLWSFFYVDFLSLAFEFSACAQAQPFKADWPMCRPWSVTVAAYRRFTDEKVRTIRWKYPYWYVVPCTGTGTWYLVQYLYSVFFLLVHFSLEETFRRKLLSVLLELGTSTFWKCHKSISPA